MTKTRWHAARLIGLLLLCGCQAQARRLLLLDLALSDPALLNGTVRPWHDEGYTVEYRRFYPHLARTDLERYRVLLFLLGREPEAPSDALTAGDLALLTEWVLRGGVVVLGYDADGEGYLTAGRRTAGSRPPGPGSRSATGSSRTPPCGLSRPPVARSPGPRADPWATSRSGRCSTPFRSTVMMSSPHATRRNSSP